MRHKQTASRLVYIATEYPWRTLILILLAVSVLSAGMTRLGFKSDYRIYFSQDNPQLLAFESIQDAYSKSDNVLFIVEPAGGDVFTKETLTAIAQLTEEAWQISYSSRVDSITNFQHTKAVDEDLLVSDLVTHPDSLTDQELSGIKQVALNEPLLVDRLVSRTGHVAGVNVTLQLPEENLRETSEAVAEARAIKEKIEGIYPGIKIHLSGVVMMSHAFVESAMNDNMTLVPIMYGIVIVVMLLTLRSLSATISTVLLIVLSITSALGVFGWFDWKLNPTSAVAPTIILTVAVADCVHILLTMLQNIEKGHEKKFAIQESLRINFHPVLLTSLTTAIGFLGMNFSDAPPFRDLGNIVAVGIVIAFLLTLTFLPALITILPVTRKRKSTDDSQSMNRLALFVIRRRCLLLFGNGVLIMVLTGFASLNELNDDFVKYFDEAIEFRRATDFLNENMGGINTIELSISSGEEGGVNEPSFLQKTELMTSWLKGQPEVVHVNTIIDTYKRLNKNMHNNDTSEYKLPEQRDLAAQYLLMYEMSLPYGLDLNDQVTPDKASTRLIVSMKSLTSNQILDLESRIQQWIAENMLDTEYDMASTALMFSHIGKRNIKSMITGSLLALLGISMLLIFAFRSLKLGLVSLIPNLVPAAVSFGIWGLISGQVGLGLSVVTSITLGIVVDDTIHFISKYQRARKEKGLSSEAAVRYAFSTVGVAIWVTSAVLVSGFIVLGFSHFTVNSGMGLLTAIMITIALLMDLLLLPPLLMVLDKK